MVVAARDQGASVFDRVGSRFSWKADMEMEASRTTAMDWRESWRVQRGSARSQVTMRAARSWSQSGRELRRRSKRAPPTLMGAACSRRKRVLTRTRRERSWRKWIRRMTGRARRA